MSTLIIGKINLLIFLMGQIHDDGSYYYYKPTTCLVIEKRIIMADYKKIHIGSKVLKNKTHNVQSERTINC